MGKGSSWEGILVERLKERIRSYKVRDPSVIYVHNFDKPIWYWFNVIEDEARVINGYTLLGELIHAGLSQIVEPASERCKTVWLPRGFPKVLDPRVSERFIHYDDSNPYVLICGTPDGLVDINGVKVPIELKSTRQNLWDDLPAPWLRRPRFYSWLYGVSKGYLIVINVITGEERDIELNAYSDEEIERIVGKWLKGLWPQKTLYG